MALSPFELHIDALGTVDVIAVRGREAMNELPRWRVSILTRTPLEGLASKVRARGELALVDAGEGTSRAIDVMIVSIAFEGHEERGARYALELSAPEHALTLRSGYRVVLDETTHEVVAEVLRKAAFPADRLVKRLGGEYRPRLHTTQYDETDWAFVERLLAEEGISYFFDHDGSKGILVLADRPGSHEGLHGSSKLPFVDASELVRPRSFRSLELAEEIAPTATHLRDFDVGHPDVPIDGVAGDAGELSYFEYPAFTLDAKQATVRATTRLEQLRRFAKRMEGESDSARLQAGRVVHVSGADDDAMNGPFLVVAVEHSFEETRPERVGSPYANRATMVPLGEHDIAFRPAVPASRPRISEIERAITTGPRGEEIHVDHLGRNKLRFPWDPAGITDDKSSTWVRSLQAQLGGSMALPRVGWEMATMFFHGNPDVPILVGRLYNATAVTPYALPGAATTQSIQSATSPGGGSTSELRLGDAAGSEELFIHAARDLSIKVGGKAKTETPSDHTRDVGQSFFEVVSGSQSNYVGGFEDVDVTTDWAIKVDGSGTRLVGGVEWMGTSANRMVGAGGTYFDLVLGAYGLECNQSNIKVKPALVQVSGAVTDFRAALGVHESVAGGRVENIGGALTVKAKTHYADKTYGAKRMQSKGAATEDVKGDVAFKATAGQVKAGTADWDAGGDNIIFEGRSVTVEAASLKASPIELSGGKLKIGGGFMVIEAAKIKRPAGAKAG